MFHFGIINSFDHTSNSWAIYKERIKQWFIANDITPTTDEKGVKRRGILLSAMSEETYKLVVELALPKDIQDVPFKDIVRILNAHFMPQCLGFTARLNFYSAQQIPLESERGFIARLRGLSKLCEFKDTEEALRDRFVLGLRPGPIRDKLFEQKLGELTLAGALKIAERIKGVQEIIDSQKSRASPFFGGTIALTGHGLQFGTQTQSSKGTVVGGTQQTAATFGFGGTTQSSPASADGGTTQSSPAAAVGGTTQSSPAAAVGGTQQTGAATGFGGTTQSSPAAAIGGTTQSSPAAAVGGTQQTGAATGFGETTQSSPAAAVGGTQQTGAAIATETKAKIRKCIRRNKNTAGEPLGQTFQTQALFNLGLDDFVFKGSNDIFSSH